MPKRIILAIFLILSLGACVKSIKELRLKDLDFNSNLVKCFYKDEDDNEYLAYIKGDQILLESLDSLKNSGKVLVKSTKLWIWDDKTKTGSFNNLAFMPADEEINMFGKIIKNNQDIIDIMLEESQSCQIENNKNINFNEPGDVNFTSH